VPTFFVKAPSFRKRRRFAPRGVAAGGTPLAAGVASFVSSGTAGIVITATDATDGTPAYTYQWQRNADGGAYGDIANGGGVSGATTLTITDDSATPGTLYGYRLVYSDAAAGEATSNAVTAQVYEGGALTGGGSRLIGPSTLIG
jgi:hypothetical protein